MRQVTGTNPKMCPVEYERGFAAWIDFQNPGDGGLRELKPPPPSVSSVSPPKPGNALTPASVILFPVPYSLFPVP